MNETVKNIIPLTERIANRKGFCHEHFTAKVLKLDAKMRDHTNIRILIYLKTLEQSATSIEVIANDLCLQKEEVIRVLWSLRKEGFVQTKPFKSKVVKPLPLF